MSKVFTRTFRVRYTELEANGWVSPASYLRYLVETAYDWGDANHLGMAESQELGLVWVIRETDMHFLHPLQFGDVFDFTIWMIRWRRVRGTRGFELRRKDNDDLIAYGIQQIVTLDDKTSHPVSPPREVIDRFFLETPKTFPPEKFPKLELPGAGFLKYSMQVRWPEMDMLYHVFNAEYVDYLQEFVYRVLDKAGWSPDRLREERLAFKYQRIQIQYQAPARWGERLDCNIWSDEPGKSGGRWYITLQRASEGDGIAAFILDWEMVDIDSGQPKDLPHDLINSLRSLGNWRKVT